MSTPSNSSPSVGDDDADLRHVSAAPQSDPSDSEPEESPSDAKAPYDDSVLFAESQCFAYAPVDMPTHKMQRAMHSVDWDPNEVPITDDLDDWNNKLTPEERHFIELVLAFFAGADGIVMDNISTRLAQEVKLMEARLFYARQNASEATHCVPGSTPILTDNGYFPIQHLYKLPEVRVWNGKSFSATKILHTSPQGPVEIYSIELSNGMTLECTTGHKWIIPSTTPSGDKAGDHVTRTTTKELKIGQVIADYKLPIIVPGYALENPYEQGFEYARFCRGEVDDKIVPLNCGLEARAKWLSGFIDGACPHSKYEITGPSDGINDIQLLIQTMGCNTMSTKISDTKRKLILTIGNFHKLKHISGFDPRVLRGVTTSEEPDLVITVVSKTNKDPQHTYCFEEHMRNAGVFNGILTGQCEVYANFINILIKDPKRQKTLMKAIKKIPCVKMKAEWARKWTNSETANFAECLIAFAIVEGVFFSGAFCSIYYLQERELMKALGLANKWISRDESLHTVFATHAYSLLKKRLTEERVHEIMIEAVKIETAFITEAIPCRLIGINAESMTKYIQFVADRLLTQLGYSKLYNVQQPFPFMDRISVPSKANFFETKPTEYSHTGGQVSSTDVFDDIDL